MSLKAVLSHPFTRLAISAAAVVQVFACAPQVATMPLPAQKYLFSAEVSGRGKPMILIPGLFSPVAVWDGVVAHYRDRYQIHVLQLPGMAGSPPVNDTALLAHVSADVQRYIRDRGLDHPVIIGHSLGGFTALSVAARAPQLVGPVISVDGLPYGAAVQLPGATPTALAATANSIRAGMRQATPRQMEAQTRQGIAAMTSTASFADTLVAWSGRTDAATAGNMIAEALMTDLRAEAAQITSPVLVVGTYSLAPDVSSRARIASAYEAQLATIPNHRLVMSENAKHFVMIDDLLFLLKTTDEFLGRVP
jgi:pimeloyl-ACP methyl ester carboxylesterase